MAQDTFKKVRTHFHVGERVKIYQKPLTQEDFEDECTLVKCVRPYTCFDWSGLVVEEWMVRFDDEPETFCRVIAVPVFHVM